MFRKTAVLLLCLLLAMPLLLAAQDTAKRGRKYTPPPPTCKITVTVTKATNGKPVEKQVNTGETIATPENMNEPAIKPLLAPIQFSD